MYAETTSRWIRRRSFPSMEIEISFSSGGKELACACNTKLVPLSSKYSKSPFFSLFWVIQLFGKETTKLLFPKEINLRYSMVKVYTPYIVLGKCIYI